ncbi:hypothetical protein BDW75DRAFT_242232 [Aspergillus navahoensis]
MEEWEEKRRWIAEPDKSPPQSDVERAIARIRRETCFDHLQNVWAHSKACLWLKDTPEYREWIEQRQSALCITGSPRCGKTCLAYSAMQDPAALQEARFRTLASVFLRIHYSEHLSLPQMIQETLPWTEDWLDDKLEQIVLRAIIQLGQSIPVFLIIYGVNNILEDDCLSQLATFLPTLVDRAVAEEIEYRILYTKRKYPVMQDLASIFRNWSCIRMDSLSQHDIHTCVKGKVESILWYLEMQTTVERLIKFITETAGTCFEVAKCVQRPNWVV